MWFQCTLRFENFHLCCQPADDIRLPGQWGWVEADMEYTQISNTKTVTAHFTNLFHTGPMGDFNRTYYGTMGMSNHRVQLPPSRKARECWAAMPLKCQLHCQSPHCCNFAGLMGLGEFASLPCQCTALRHSRAISSTLSVISGSRGVISRAYILVTRCATVLWHIFSLGRGVKKLRRNFSTIF